MPDPVARPGEVVLAIGAALSCATDVKSVARGHPSIVAYPSRLGHEFAGTVLAGAGQGFAPGDRVFCGNSAPCGACRACARGRESLCEDLRYLLGGFAERVLVPARIVERNLHRIPDGLDLRTAALAEPLGLWCTRLTSSAWPARRRTRRGRRGRDVAVVLGAGSLGVMQCALLSAAGARTVVLDPHPERLPPPSASAPPRPSSPSAARPTSSGCSR